MMRTSTRKVKQTNKQTIRSLLPPTSWPEDSSSPGPHLELACSGTVGPSGREDDECFLGEYYSDWWYLHVPSMWHGKRVSQAPFPGTELKNELLLGPWIGFLSLPTTKLSSYPPSFPQVKERGMWGCQAKIHSCSTLVAHACNNSASSLIQHIHLTSIEHLLCARHSKGQNRNSCCNWAYF